MDFPAASIRVCVLEKFHEAKIIMLTIAAIKRKTRQAVESRDILKPLEEFQDEGMSLPTFPSGKYLDLASWKESKT